MKLEINKETKISFNFQFLKEYKNNSIIRTNPRGLKRNWFPQLLRHLMYSSAPVCRSKKFISLVLFNY